MQALTAFMVITLVFYVMYGMNPTAPLFTTSEGWGHIAIYYILVLTAGMVVANFSGVRAFTLGLLMFFVFAGIGERTRML